MEIRSLKRLLVRYIHLRHARNLLLRVIRVEDDVDRKAVEAANCVAAAKDVMKYC
jgi:hypothetical protein